jgi:hypothetical protein
MLSEVNNFCATARIFFSRLWDNPKNAGKFHRNVGKLLHMQEYALHLFPKVLH